MARTRGELGHAAKTARIHPIDEDIVSRHGAHRVLGVEAYATLVPPELFGAAA